MKWLRVLGDVARTLAWAAWAGAAMIVMIYAPGLLRQWSGGSASSTAPGVSGTEGANPPAAAFSTVEFVTIILTATAVILAALAIILALAGAIGYATFRKAAQAAGRDAGGVEGREIAERLMLSAVTEARARAEQVAEATAIPVATRVAEAAIVALRLGASSDDADAIAAAQDKGEA